MFQWTQILSVFKCLSSSACYLQRGGLLVYWSDEDYQLVVQTQVTKDVTLWHRDVKPQVLQDIQHRHRLVLVQLQQREHRRT